MEDGSSPLWNSLKSSKRCVIPVDGFFEWLLQGKEKMPHFTKRKDDHMMLFAGLHDRFQTKEQTIDSFTIITTSASKQFEAIHNRMPVILDKEGALKWLDKSKKWDVEICHLLKPYHDSLDIYAVTKEMSKPGSSKSSYIQPISDRKDGIKSFFAKQAQSQKKTASLNMISRRRNVMSNRSNTSLRLKTISPRRRKMTSTQQSSAVCKILILILTSNQPRKSRRKTITRRLMGL